MKGIIGVSAVILMGVIVVVAVGLLSTVVIAVSALFAAMSFAPLMVQLENELESRPIETAETPLPARLSAQPVRVKS